MKLIIELSNGTVYSVKKKDRFTWGTLDELKEAIKKGKPLKTELEEIKAELHKRIKIQYDACFGDERDVYCFHKAYEVSSTIVDNVFEEYVNK